MLVDLRGRIGRLLGLPATTGHPYDVAGAKKLLAEAQLDKEILKEALEGNY